MPDDHITRVEERRSWRQAWLWGAFAALALAVLILIAVPLYNYLVPNPGGQDRMAAKYDLPQQPIGAVAPATVKTKRGAYAQFLTDGAGHPLYLFDGDTRARGDVKAVSTCYGNCANSWPPLVTSGQPKATSGVRGDLLSTLKRKDGSEQVTYQVTYNGWPLYRFVRDVGPQQESGEGLSDYDGKWYLVSPDGKEIEANADDKSRG
jgi:predicted lipoprotein with Yx(FWY)xxD motif